MSSFTPQSIIETNPFQSAYGTLYSVKMAGLLDGNLETSVTINVKDPNKLPIIGAPLDVSIEDHNKYGIRIKKLPPPLPGQQVAIPVPGVTTATPATPAKPFYDRSDEREYIVRQSTLERANEYCIAKANLLALYGTAAQKKQAFGYLEGKKVLEVAHYFFKYAMGEIDITRPTGSEVFTRRHEEIEEDEQEEPQLPPAEPEIDISDIPF